MGTFCAVKFGYLKADFQKLMLIYIASLLCSLGALVPVYGATTGVAVFVLALKKIGGCSWWNAILIGVYSRVLSLSFLIVSAMLFRG